MGGFISDGNQVFDRYDATAGQLTNHRMSSCGTNRAGKLAFQPFNNLGRGFGQIAGQSLSFCLAFKNHLRFAAAKYALRHHQQIFGTRRSARPCRCGGGPFEYVYKLRTL